MAHSPETVKAVHKLAKMNVSQREIARSQNLTKGQVQHILDYENPIPDEFCVINLPQPLDLTGDFMVVGDVHVPATDWNFASRVQRVAERNGIGSLLVGGDYWSMDVYSKFPHITTPPTFEQEYEAAQRLLQDWLMTFDHVYFLMGNHERMMQKANSGHFEDWNIFGCLSTSSKVESTNLGYLWVTSGDRRWYVAHGREYSVNPLTVGNKLAQKFQANIISHHQHHVGVTRDEFDRYDVVDNGTLADQGKFAYVTMDTNKKPNMKRAFTMIRHGFPKQFVLNGITDWSEWGFDN